MPIEREAIQGNIIHKHLIKPCLVVGEKKILFTSYVVMFDGLQEITILDMTMQNENKGNEHDQHAAVVQSQKSFNPVSCILLLKWFENIFFVLSFPAGNMFPFISFIKFSQYNVIRPVTLNITILRASTAHLYISTLVSGVYKTFVITVNQ